MKRKKKEHAWVTKKIELELVGIQHRVTPSTRRFLRERVKSNKMEVEFVREPENVHDENAIAVFASDDSDNPYRGMKLGYLRRQVASVLALPLDDVQAEFGKSYLTSVNVEEGTGDLQVKLQVRKNLKVPLDKLSKRR